MNQEQNAIQYGSPVVRTIYSLCFVCSAFLYYFYPIFVESNGLIINIIGLFTYSTVPPIILSLYLLRCLQETERYMGSYRTFCYLIYAPIADLLLKEAIAFLSPNESTLNYHGCQSFITVLIVLYNIVVPTTSAHAIKFTSAFSISYHILYTLFWLLLIFNCNRLVLFENLLLALFTYWFRPNSSHSLFRVLSKSSFDSLYSFIISFTSPEQYSHLLYDDSHIHILDIHKSNSVEFYEPNETVNEQENYEQYVFPDPPMNMHPPPPPLSPNEDVVSQEPEVDVSEENIQLLMGMGFSRDEAIYALKKCYNDPAAAVNELL